MRWSAVLLGLVVLRTKVRNGFCPMCTKECCMVLTRLKPFWGQFWGQICEGISHSHRSNKCTALVSLRNYGLPISQGSHAGKAPRTNDEVLLSSKKLYENQLHAIPTHRPCRREKCPCLGTFAMYRRSSRPVKYRPTSLAFRGFFILPQRHLPKQDFPVQVNPTQINN